MACVVNFASAVTVLDIEITLLLNPTLNNVERANFPQANDGEMDTNKLGLTPLTGRLNAHRKVLLLEIPAGWFRPPITTPLPLLCPHRPPVQTLFKWRFMCALIPTGKPVLLPKKRQLMLLVSLPIPDIPSDKPTPKLNAKLPARIGAEHSTNLNFRPITKLEPTTPLLS